MLCSGVSRSMTCLACNPDFFGQKKASAVGRWYGLWHFNRSPLWSARRQAVNTFWEVRSRGTSICAYSPNNPARERALLHTHWHNFNIHTARISSTTWTIQCAVLPKKTYLKLQCVENLLVQCGWFVSSLVPRMVLLQSRHIGDITRILSDILVRRQHCPKAQIRTFLERDLQRFCLALDEGRQRRFRAIGVEQESFRQIQMHSAETLDRCCGGERVPERIRDPSRDLLRKRKKTRQRQRHTWRNKELFRG